MKYLVKETHEGKYTQIRYWGISNERVAWDFPWSKKPITEARVKLYGYKTEKGAIRACEKEQKRNPESKYTVVQFAM